MQASRFATARYRPPIISPSGPMEPDEPSEPKEPMPLKTRLATFLEQVQGFYNG